MPAWICTAQQSSGRGREDPVPRIENRVEPASRRQATHTKVSRSSWLIAGAAARELPGCPPAGCPVGSQVFCAARIVMGVYLSPFVLGMFLVASCLCQGTTWDVLRNVAAYRRITFSLLLYNPQVMSGGRFDASGWWFLEVPSRVPNAHPPFASSSSPGLQDPSPYRQRKCLLLTVQRLLATPSSRPARRM